MTFTLHAHYGFRPWMAEITGTSSQYGFAQTFIRADERTHSRSGATGDNTYEIDTPGLYRIGGTKRDNEIFMLWIKNGELVRTTVDQSRASQIAKLMDAGEEFNAARLATKAVAK